MDNAAMTQSELKHVLTIHDSFDVEGGICVVGVNSEFDAMSDEAIQQRIGASVVLKRSDEKSGPYDVLGVETTTSLGNKKNIALKLPATVPGAFLWDGTEVLASA